MSTAYLTTKVKEKDLMAKDITTRKPLTARVEYDIVDIVDMINQPEGLHQIKRELLSMSVPEICHLQQLALESTSHDFSC